MFRIFSLFWVTPHPHSPMTKALLLVKSLLPSGRQMGQMESEKVAGRSRRMIAMSFS